VALAFEKYSKGQRLTWALLIGGVSFGDQTASSIVRGRADRHAGRLLDHFERGNLLLNGVQIMVVDEADRMLDMGSSPISSASSNDPAKKQRCFSRPPCRRRSPG